MKKNRMIFVMLGLLFVFAISPGFASDSVVTVSEEELKAQGFLLLPNSLSITIPNIDVSKIKDLRPLFDSQKESLIKKGYNKEFVEKLTIDDYINITKTWQLTPEDVATAKFIYPQLEDIDISNWTFGDFQEFYTKVDNKTYAPDSETAIKLSKRNINLADARYLLKEFHTYENILAQPDSLLKSILEKRNKHSLEYVTYVTNHDKSEVDVLATPPPEHIHRYVYINFPGYGWDYFHVDSGSDNPNTALWQSGMAKSAFWVIYNVESTPKYTNLWGTYSEWSNGTHEGIEFVYRVNPPVYSIVNDGKVIQKLDNVGKLAMYDNTRTYNTAFYNHLNTIIVQEGARVRKTQEVGTQGKKGNASGEHVHFEVQYGETKDQSLAKDNHNLDSANPYIFISRQ